ncbi:MAG: alpha/beta hydrolase, partial [Saprospiraceae bacterium]|nr:alpha/beta hydrolase [Saprospiraceae bacterium]
SQVPCDFLEGLSLSGQIECGEITVPENHDDPNARQIQICYAIIRTTSGEVNYPVIHLSGGPGGRQLSMNNIEYWSNHPFRENRDIILFDQRGIGFSWGLPSIEAEHIELIAADANEEQEYARIQELLTTYQQICQEKGIRLEHYNSFQNARDVGVLMQQLGYDRYSIYSSSYGTRLGRIVIEMFPEYLHAVIFNSPNPLEGDMLIDRLHSYSLALERLFDFCAEDDDCQNEYPDLKNIYLQAMAMIDENPIEFAFDGKPFAINAQDAVYLLRRKLYAADSRTTAPPLIMELKTGGGPTLRQVIAQENNFASFLNFSMWLSVERYEMFNPTITDEEIDSVYRTLPLLPARLGFFDAMYRSMEDWHDATMPDDDKKFKPSTVPSLITVNQYDPVTPPENGWIFKRDLINSHLFILDEGGHGGGNFECKAEVMISFLDKPLDELDPGCLNIYHDNK